MLTQVLSDKIAILSTTQENNYYMTLLDTSNNIIWQYNYSYPRWIYSLNSVSNGNIIITGGIYSGGDYISMKRISIFGDSISAKNFPYQGFSLIGARSTCTTNDNGFILTGSADIIFKSHILMVKTDSLFNSPIITNISHKSEFILNDFELYHNYPNPFNSSTCIKFRIPDNGNISIKVYDISGRKILNSGNQFYFKGLNTFILDANKYNLCSGIYFFIIEYKEHKKSLKLVYLK